MDISKDITLLKGAAETDKLEIFKKIINGLLGIVNKDELNLAEKDIEEFCQEILNNLEHSFSHILLEQLELLLKECKSLKCIFTDIQMNNIVKGIIKVIKVSENEKDLILCFSCLNETLSVTELENDTLEDLLGNAADIICKKSVPVSVHINICSYMQKCFKHYESKLSCFMHIIPRLVYLPLIHNSGKVREIAEKTLDNFPKLVLYAENEEGSNVLLKLIKESYCKELLLLFKEKQELYVLKIWKTIVNGLGKTLHRNLPTITPFFQIIEKGFKSQDDEVCKSAFISWKSLISNFAMDDSVLNDSKKLRFVLKPFRNLSKFSELVSFAVCETWWHLAWSLSNNLSSRFDEVLMPLLEFAFGKNTKSQIFLVKRGCHILLRLLEQPQNNSLNRISSPKKLPPLMYPPLQLPLDLKVIVRHSKEIMSMIQVVIEVFGNVKDMTSHIDCLLKSVLFVLSSVIEDKNKESVEAVISFVNFVNNVIESQLCSPLTCLKCVDSLSKLPRFVLVSHYFHCGPRKQDILCTSLLRLLVNPYLFSTEISNKRFLMAYNRLIQAGLGESLNPLSMAHKLINIVKQVTAQNLDAEILFEMWSGIASPLLEAIEKTQEVNQGTGQEHDFSCLYDVLLCPFENIFPVSLNQLRTKPAFRLWTNLYKTFVRCASLVPTTLPNEACEHFCARLKNYFKDELLKEPQYFETVCFLLQVVLESIDFTSVVVSSTPVFASPSMLLKKKKPLGKLTSFVELLSVLLTSFYKNYIENEDDIYQQPLLLEESCTPKAQRKGHISKAVAPLDLVKTFFENLKTGVVISSALEELAPALSKLFAISLTKTQIGSKLEVFWNVLTSAIEMHYLGPYDTDFLTIMCPLLEFCFTHPRRHIKERSRRFWFATFAPASSSLIMPETLKTILKKSKLSLMPDEQVSSLEDYSLNPASDSIEDEVINFEKCSDVKDLFVKPTDIKLKDFKYGDKEADSKQIKDKKLGFKKSVDELPNDEFVIIDSPAAGSLTPKRRSFRCRKSFVPAMYNDLSQSQETTTLGGSSESFDTSSSCEIMEFKSQEESEKLIASNHELDFGKNKEEINSKKEEESQNFNSSIEVLSNQNDTDCNERKKLISQETNTAENETASKNTKPSLEKETTFSEIHKNDGQSVETIESCDVIVVTSSDSINSQEIEVDSKNMSQEMPNCEEIGDGLFNLKSPSFSKGESRISEQHGRKRSPSGELLNSQELVNNGDSSQVSFDDNVKDRESVTKKENEAVIIKKGRRECDSDEVQDSQKNINKKFKSNTESTSKNLAFPKKNGKSKQNGRATHLKKTSKSDYKKPLQQKNPSESLPLCAVSNKSEEQSILSKSNQSCIEIIDLDDSDDIIPSSQSSGDSTSCIKLPAKDMSPINPRRMLTFNSPKDSENKLNKSEVKSETYFAKDCIEQNVNNSDAKESNECPETPTDLIQSMCDDIVAEVMNQVSPFVTKTISSMPLKSSENLVILDEHLNKTENKTIKTALSDVLMKTDDETKMLIAENKPPLFTDIYTIQTSEPVILRDKLCIEDEPSVDIKFAKSADSVENVFKEDSPKTVRVKSLRSANKNVVRKSFSCAGNKKISKRPSKRKSLPALNAPQKINKLDTDDENMDSETNFDQLTSNEMVKSSENTSQSKKESKDTVEYPASVEDDNEQNSVLEDINKVILDIQEKIMSYNEGHSCDLYLNEKLENEQDSDKGCLLSPSNQVDKDFEKQNEKLRDNDVKKLEIISNNNHNICELIENTGRDSKTLSGDQSEVDLCSDNAEKSAVIDTNSDLENEKSLAKTDLVTSVQLTENEEVESSKLVEDKLSDVVSEDKNVEAKNFEIKTDLQLDTDSAVESCGEDFNLKSQDENEENKNEIIIDKNNTSDETAFENIETCEESELMHDETMQDHQIKILGVVSVKDNYITVSENFDKESSPNSVVENTHGSPNELLTADVPEEDAKNKSNETMEVSATAETNKIDSDIAKIVQDSFSSEIEEIEETCDIVDQHLTRKTEEVIFKQKNIQKSGNDDGVINEIAESQDNIIKPEFNGFVQTDESCMTKDLDENKQDNEKCDESAVNETENMESGINKNLTVIKLKSDSELPVDPKTDLQMSHLEIYDVENHCIDTDSHENLEDEKWVEFHNSDHSNTVTVSKTSSVSQINNKEMESSSRRRKPKCPVRSPFNFRQRSNLIVSMSNTLPKDSEPNSGKIASKKTVQNKTPENAVKKIKKHIEPKIKAGSSITSENSNKLDSLMNNSNSSHEPAEQEVKKAASSVKRLKVSLNLKEMTDVNTRFNASIAPQTRRLKMLADVHNLQPLEDDDPTSNENDSIYTEDNISASMSSTSILKKRKASFDGSHSKMRKVTFADPLVEERLFSNDDNLSERILRVSAQMNIVEQQNSISSSDVEKVVETNISSSEEMPSSSEYQSSDNLTDYNNLPISPLLVNCEESISCIIKDLTSPTWAQGLMTLLLAKNIRTIGDLCKLNVHELKDLPIKSPKVSCLHKALLAHLQHTQEVTAAKVNTTENWFTDTTSSENRNKENEPDVNREDEKMDESISSEVIEKIAEELLTNDRIGQIKKETLLALSKKCFQEVTKRLEDH